MASKVRLLAAYLLVVEESLRGVYRNSRYRQRSEGFWAKYGTVVMIVSLVALILFDLISPYGLWHYRKMKEHYQLLYAKIGRLREENTALQEKIRAFETDKQFQEQLVRSRLGWLKKDELLYVFKKK